jgi:glycopeptide antibiotics resistance protein
MIVMATVSARKGLWNNVRSIFAQSTPMRPTAARWGTLSYRFRLLVWILLICLAVVPWTDLQNHSHWARVQWIPFVTPPIKLADIIVNIVLYVPFGYWFVRWRGRRRAGLAVASAAALSLVTEWTQLYSHSRFPSLTDVTCNVIGTLLGVWFAQQFI